MQNREAWVSHQRSGRQSLQLQKVRVHGGLRQWQKDGPVQKGISNMNVNHIIILLLLESATGWAETHSQSKFISCRADVLQWADIEEAFYLEMPHFEQSLGLITDIPGFEIFSRRGFKRELWGYWMTQKPSSLKKHSKFTMRTLMRHAPPGSSRIFHHFC